MRGDHRLVGGDHRNPALERRLDRLVGHAVGAADQLDEHVDFAARRQLSRIGKEPGGAEIDAAVALGARAHGRDKDVAPGPRQKVAAHTSQQPG